jgi:hypothetical protein
MVNNIFVGSLSELISREWGVRTDYRINPLTDEVNSTITQILNSNPKRVGFVILNLSDDEVYISPDQRAADNRGIELKANGGSVTMSWKEDFNLVNLPWYGIAANDNDDIFVIEVFLV